MRNYISLAVIAALAVLMAASPAAARDRLHAPKIAPLRLALTAGRTASACTRRVPDSWTAAVWVYANGHDLASTAGGA